ncbi:hypothetical protein ZIOFF_032654 [Zingiber officinale]|uniref:Uncharacterized protein n=1 Tax=Zingiber officinale TaxID=94328 RepID=A0A8J5GIQ4_ZINOF|nr:hypothetical protein ZIOFF_032654 [Zingiber officinale]
MWLGLHEQSIASKWSFAAGRQLTSEHAPRVPIRVPNPAFLVPLFTNPLHAHCSIVSAVRVSLSPSMAPCSALRSSPSFSKLACRRGVCSLHSGAMLGSSDCSMGNINVYFGRRSTGGIRILTVWRDLFLGQIGFRKLGNERKRLMFCYQREDSKLVASRANNFCLSNLFAGFVLPSISHQFQLVFFSTLQRFHLLFTNLLAQDLIEMAKEHEETGRMEQMHEQLFSAYCQLPAESPNSGSSHCGTGIWQRKLRAIAS